MDKLMRLVRLMKVVNQISPRADVRPVCGSATKMGTSPKIPELRIRSSTCDTRAKGNARRLLRCARWSIYCTLALQVAFSLRVVANMSAVESPLDGAPLGLANGVKRTDSLSMRCLHVVGLRRLIAIHR